MLMKKNLKVKWKTLVNNYFTRLISGEIIGVGIITNFVKRLESTFKNCKTHNISKYNNEDWSTLEGKELWTRISWSGKLSSKRTYDTPEDEKLLKLFEKLYCPGQEPPIENFVAENGIFIPVTDSAINLREVKDAYHQQKKGYNFTKSILEPVKDILFNIVLTLFNMIFFSVTSIMWAPSMLFLRYLHYVGPQYAVSQLPTLCGPPVCCLSFQKKGNLTLPKNWRDIQ